MYLGELNGKRVAVKQLTGETDPEKAKIAQEDFRKEIGVQGIQSFSLFPRARSVSTPFSFLHLSNFFS